ncbi:MAG: hypothetical protein HY903_05685 [Deltaproteobacteria bacterium]|nr:hypothetical protein [Deltaproteobacteria bacterium]
MSVDVESILRTVDHELPPFPPKVIMLATGEPMVIRQASRDEIPDILPHVEALIHHDRDFYDVVAARVYSELLGHFKHRYQDQYLLVAQCDGHLAAVVNGRAVDAKTGMSLHTLGLRRGLRAGAHAFAAKMEYHFDQLGHQEVLIVAESPIGFRRWMIEYKLEKRFEIPHELGGCPSWSLTRALFDRARGSLVVGSRPVGKELLAKAMAAILPPTDPPKMAPDFLAATRARYDSTGTAIIARTQK